MPCNIILYPGLKGLLDRLQEPSAKIQRPVRELNGGGLHGPQSDKSMDSKPVRELNGGLDPKLVEIINSVIVDRSLSIKWEDIG
ncbi:hypothetical protein Hanom_Chr00s030639g01769851 [Helianthus anomalus]